MSSMSKWKIWRNGRSREFRLQVRVSSLVLQSFCSSLLNHSLILFCPFFVCSSSSSFFFLLFFFFLLLSSSFFHIYVFFYSGVCESGYFCNLGSINPFSSPCNEPKDHCPRGTSERRRTVEGYLSVPNGTSTISISLQTLE